jgi:hypothetical protein
MLGADFGGQRACSSDHPSGGRRDSPQCVLSTGGSGHEVRYLAETDTLHLEFRNVPVAETRHLDENTLLDIDPESNTFSDHGATPAADPYSDDPSRRPTT